MADQGNEKLTEIDSNSVKVDNGKKSDTNRGGTGDLLSTSVKHLDRSVNQKSFHLTSTQQRRFAAMQKNPEMQQARQELQDEFLATHPRFAQMASDELQQEMATHAREEDKVRKQKLRRHMESFSDGVIAVIITIMLLEIPMPTGRTGYWDFLSSVGIFLISFLVIANFWFNHHKTFAVTEEITEGILVQDFIFLGLLSLIPLLTKWIMVQPTAFSSVNYGVVLLLILVQQEGLNYGITKDHFRHMPKAFKFWRKIWARRLVLTLTANVVITLIAIATPFYGHWLFVVVPIFYFFARMLSDREHRFEFDQAPRPIGVPYLKH